MVVARGQRARLPMAGDWREGRGLPGDGQSRWHKFAGLAGTCAGRARAGCCAAGLAAGGWLLAPGSWLRGRGGSAARLRLHWGPAAPRGALTSAPGALCARSEGRDPAAGAPGWPAVLAASSGTPQAGGRGNARSWGGGGIRSGGSDGSGGADPRPRNELFNSCKGLCNPSLHPLRR